MLVKHAQSNEERIAVLEASVASLRQSLRELDERQQASAPEQSTVPTEVNQTRPEDLIGEQPYQVVRRLTEEMFAGHVAGDVDSDPEWPQERFVLFRVAVRGSIQDLIEMQRQWQRQVLKLVPAKADIIRISITPQ